MKIKTNLAYLKYLAAIFGIVFGSSILTAVTVFADEQVSAPPVVAPAQPAGAAVNTTAPAAAPVAGAPAQTQGGGFQMLLMIAGMFAVMYFMMIRPQQKRMKEHQALLGGLKNGDEVITASGILGTITGLSDKVVNLEISKNVQIKVLKSQVNQVVKGNLNEIQG